MAQDSLPVEHIGTLTATLLQPRNIIASGPMGTRGTATATTGTFVGPRITAAIPEGVACADWFVIRSDGIGALDVRINLVTDDGAEIYLTYLGMDIDGALKISPRFETGDERYAWLNRVFAVGIGRVVDDTVQYEVYAL